MCTASGRGGTCTTTSATAILREATAQGFALTSTDLAAVYFRRRRLICSAIYWPQGIWRAFRLPRDGFGPTKTRTHRRGHPFPRLLKPHPGEGSIRILPGQYRDAETGLFYNYFRDYDPQTGRYVQSDPIGLLAGFNTYLYVGGNPLKWGDPKGLFVETPTKPPGTPPSTRPGGGNGRNCTLALVGMDLGR